MPLKHQPQPATTRVGTCLNQSQQRLIYLKLTLVVMLLMAAVLLSDSKIASTQATPQSGAAKSGQTSTEQQAPATRFDFIVREDFFAGMAGNREAFNRAMKVCEDALAKNPKHAEAMVWHGSGLLFLGGQAFQAGDFNKGADLWQRGEKEMKDAVALQPDLGTLIPRGATLIEASKHVPNPTQAKTLLETGVGDYEKALELQKPYFSTLPIHARGEFLWGLAEGWHRLNNAAKAQEYFQRIVKECAGSSYAEKAQAWLEKKPLPEKHGALSCTGCHAR